MVDQIAVVTFTTPAAPGTVDVTSPLITEAFSAALLIYSGFTTDDADNGHGLLGIGFVAPDGGATRTAEGMCSSAEDANASAPNCNALHAVTAGVVVQDPTSAVAGAAVVGAYSASIAGGVRLNFTTTAIQVKVTAILFAGLTRAYTDDASATAVSGHEPVGGTTQFQPDLAAFAASGGGLGTGQQDAIPNMGFACNKAGLPQVHAYVRMDDGTEPTDGDGFVRSADCYGAFANTTNTRESANITSFDATGWNEIANTGSPQAHYLALKFSGAFRMACDNFGVSASATDQDFNFGFTPDVVVGMVTLMTAEDSAVDGPTASAAGFFVTGRFGSRAYTMCHKEGINIPADGNTLAKSRQEDVAVLCYDHLGTVVLRGTLVGGTGSGGIRINFSTASQAGMLTMLGIQVIPSPPPGRGHPQAVSAPARRGERHIQPPGGARHSGIGRVLREIARFRRAALARLRWRPLPEAEPMPVVPGVPVDPDLTAGDNASAGSSVGSTAMAGSAEGDG